MEIEVADGQIIKAHAGVLAARCSIFRAMLTSGTLLYLPLSLSLSLYLCLYNSFI
jgi:BTB/POZ domain